MGLQKIRKPVTPEAVHTLMNGVFSSTVAVMSEAGATVVHSRGQPATSDHISLSHEAIEELYRLSQAYPNAAQREAKGLV